MLLRWEIKVCHVVSGQTRWREARTRKTAGRQPSASCRSLPPPQQPCPQSNEHSHDEHAQRPWFRDGGDFVVGGVVLKGGAAREAVDRYFGLREAVAEILGGAGEEESVVVEGGADGVGGAASLGDREERARGVRAEAGEEEATAAPPAISRLAWSPSRFQAFARLSESSFQASSAQWDRRHRWRALGSVIRLTSSP